MAKSEKLVIFDGNALLHRAWHALPPLQTKDGTMVNAVYGFLLVFLKVLKELKPTHLVVTFDRQEPTFRHKVYVEYKATRQKQPDELYDQLPLLKNVLQAFNVAVVEAKGYEADDVIGTIVTRAQKNNLPSIIVTGDLDTLQLVNNITNVYTLRKGLTDSVIYDVVAVQKRYGLKPELLVEYRGLKGDPSDNLPGVKGVGEKTAKAIIQKYNTLEKLYQSLRQSKITKVPLTPRLRELLLKYKKDAFTTRELSIIKCDVPLDFSLEDYVAQVPNMDKVVDLFQRLEFKSLLAKLPVPIRVSSDQNKIKISKQKTGNYVLINDKKSFLSFVNKLKRCSVFALDTETTSLNSFKADLLGLSFCWRAGEAYYVVVDNCPHRLDILKPILENDKIKKWGHNLKYDIEVLASSGVNLKGIKGDTMIASYLLNPGSRAHDLDTLAFVEFGYRKIPITRLIGEKKSEQKTMREVPLEKVAEYASEDADYTWRLVKRFVPELKKAGLLSLFEKIEIPLIPVLVTLETNGIKLDPKVLKELSLKVGRRLSILEKSIYKLAGEEFNVASPKQLKVILFEKLKLSTAGISKTKTGYSTAASELEKMRGEHKIIEAIIEHRELAKLQSTYLEALPRLISDDLGRIHTSFNQTITATGRLSSSNPNLQNIPIRTELGALVRNAFVANKGMNLLSADYSQIELRIVASLSNDKTMLDIFRRGEDIHLATAAKIHGVPLSEVTSAMRYAAKEVNFGVIYGMGAWGLAARTDFSNAEAKDFIAKYFQAFSGVKKYLEETIVRTKKLGYAETMFGRKRYVPELSSGVSQVRQAGERIAVNMPIQGTAADLMKMAMIAVHSSLSQIFPTTKLVLQVHDELVLEVPNEDLVSVAKFVRDKMENIAQLKIPIEVHLKNGQSWGDTKPFIV